MSIELTTTHLLWGALVALCLLALWVLSAKRPFGGEDDLWSAQRLCDLLAPRLGVSAEQVAAMWAAPAAHAALARRAAELIGSVERESSQGAPGGPVTAKLLVTWRDGRRSEVSAEAAWDDLPRVARGHVIREGQTPLSLSFSPSFLSAPRS